MTDLFKSAFSYLAGSGSERENEFVGQLVELGNLKLDVKRVIAEGGFAFVYVVVDQQGREFALKRLLAVDKSSADAIVQEITVQKKLTGHPNIVQFIQAAGVGRTESKFGKSEFLLVTELCTGGPLINVLRDRREPFSCNQVLQIFYQTSRAVQHMHRQKPPVIHRDLKIENLLLTAHQNIKLCDFGSATTKTYQPDNSWTVTQRSMLEDEMCSHTTPMYRPPEMLDLYQNFPINEAMDVWALGCILYYLCYSVHPFEDSAKLRILNAKYTIPENDRRCEVFHDLIYGMLQIDPRRRPTVNDVVDRLEEIAAAREVDLTLPPELGLGRPHLPTRSMAAADVSAPNAAPAGPTRVARRLEATDPSPAAPGGGFLGSIKGQAGSLFKNLKDSVQTVAARAAAGDSRQAGTASPSPPVAHQGGERTAPQSGGVTAFTDDVSDEDERDRVQQARPSRRDDVPPRPKPPRPPSPVASQLRAKCNSDHTLIEVNSADAERRDRSRSPYDAAEAAERAAGIRVSAPLPVDESTDVEHTDEVVSAPTADLLNLSLGGPTPQFSSQRSSPATLSSSHADELDLLGSFTQEASRPAGRSTTPMNIADAASTNRSMSFDPFQSSSLGNNAAPSGRASNEEDWLSAGSTKQRAKEDGTSDLLKDWSDLPLGSLGGTAAASATSFRHVTSAANLTAPAGMHRIPSAPNFGGLQAMAPAAPGCARPKFDPFSDLGNFSSGAPLTGGGAPARSASSTPTHQFSSTAAAGWTQPVLNRPSVAVPGAAASMAPPQQFGRPPAPTNSWTSGATTLNGTGTGSATPTFARHAHAAAPSGSTISWDSSSSSTIGPKKLSENAFDDLLGGFNPSSKPQAPTKLKELRREEEVKDLDPDQLKIRDWTEGKRRNIRALICSLHSILWDGNDKWEEVTMSQLLTAGQVKKFYRKACLAVHPDKLTGSPYENLARLAFTELNDAWNAFEQSGEPSLA